MSDIGPSLPPHLLAKRKRRQEEESKIAGEAEPGAKPTDVDGEKRRRIAGPAMPPAPLEERPSMPANQIAESDSEDDDDIGPALPSSRDDEGNTGNLKQSHSASLEPAVTEEKVRRDEWMMMPPKQDDLAARMDPTKQRARGFNTGRSAASAATNGDDNSAWHETPEQKQKRLADEMMGVSKSSNVGPQRPTKESSGGATARKVKDHTEKIRGPSLMEQHQSSKGKEAEDDDPSKRAFDREKDMSTGMHVGHAQRKEMLNKAANFSSKFSGGSYL